MNAQIQNHVMGSLCYQCTNIGVLLRRRLNTEGTVMQD